MTPQKEKIPENEGSETLPDSPLLDLFDAAVKELIRSAKRRNASTRSSIRRPLLAPSLAESRGGLLTKDEARRMVNIAKPPELLQR